MRNLAYVSDLHIYIYRIKNVFVFVSAYLNCTSEPQLPGVPFYITHEICDYVRSGTFMNARVDEALLPCSVKLRVGDRVDCSTLHVPLVMKCRDESTVQVQIFSTNISVIELYLTVGNEPLSGSHECNVPGECEKHTASGMCLTYSFILQLIVNIIPQLILLTVVCLTIAILNDYQDINNMCILSFYS